MSTEPALLVEQQDAVAILTNNDPPRNRMSLEFMDALEEQIQRIRDDASVRAVLITGSGDEHFSVGMDLKQLPEGVKRKGSIEAVFDQRLRVLAAIEQLEKPVIAINTALYWHALRQNGIDEKIPGWGRLLVDF